MGVALQTGEVRTGLPVTAFPAGLPAVEAGRRGHAGVVAFAEPPALGRRGRRRLAIPALLVAGWGGLFAYCAAYLREDLPFRPTEAGAPAEDLPRRQFVLPDIPGEAPRDVASQDVSPRDVPQAAPEPERPATALASVPAAVAGTRPGPAQASADYVGLWGPTPGACGRPSRRRGYLPATITPDRARAGRTVCSFHDGRRAGNAWVMAAECSDRGRRWSSQVRLVVEGDHLTWTSNRGTASYTRCRRAG